MLKQLFVILYVLLFSFLGYQNLLAAPVIVIDSLFEEVTLINNFEYKIIDEEQSNSTFEIITKKNLVLGTLNKEVVLQTVLFNATQQKQELVIQIANSNLDHFVIQTYQNGEIVDIIEFGDSFKFSERLFAHRNFIYNCSLSAQDSLHLVIKVKPQKEAFYFPLTIETKSDFRKSSTKDHLLLGLILGVFFIYICIIFGLYIAANNKLFLFYGIIDLSILIYIIYDTGIGYQYLWSQWPFMQDLIVVLAGTGYVFGMVSFGREFLSTRIKYPKYDKLFQAINILALLSFLSILVCYFIFGALLIIPVLILNLLLLAFGIIISGLGIITYIQSKRRQGFWFLILFVIQLTMWVFVLNQRMYWGINILSPDNIIYSFLPFKTAMPHYLFVNFMIEIVLVSAIIAYSFQDVLDEYNVSQLRMEFLNQESIKAFIKGQEVERHILAEELNHKVGLDLKSIKRKIESINKSVPNHEEFEAALEQIDDIQGDLGRIASDYVMDWSEISLRKIAEKVHDQLKMAVPEIEIDLYLDSDDKFDNINDLAKLNVYRILQEVCNNIIKHAHAKSVKSSFTMDSNNLNIEIEDNGVGFEYDDSILRKGIGLRNIDTRVKALNGNLEIAPIQNTGTVIKISIPIEITADI